MKKYRNPCTEKWLPLRWRVSERTSVFFCCCLPERAKTKNCPSQGQTALQMLRFFDGSPLMRTTLDSGLGAAILLRPAAGLHLADTHATHMALPQNILFLHSLIIYLYIADKDCNAEPIKSPIAINSLITLAIISAKKKKTPGNRKNKTSRMNIAETIPMKKSFNVSSPHSSPSIFAKERRFLPCHRKISL